MKKSSVYISIIMVVLLALAAALTAGCKAAFPEGQQAAPGPAEATSEPTEPDAEVTPEPAETAAPEPTEEPAPYEATAFFTERRLSPTIIKTVDESKVGAEKTIEIGGKELELYYVQSVRADIGNVDYEEYGIVDCSKNSTVSLNQDGSIKRLHIDSNDSQLFKIDVSWTDGIDKIRAAAEQFFMDKVDFSRYERFSQSGSNRRTLVWEHYVNGLSVDDCFELTLTEDCSVFSVAVFKPHFNWDNLPEDFNLGIFMPLIEQTAKKEYGEGYISSNVMGYTLTDTEGLPSFRCQMGVNYRDSKGERTSDGRELIIQFHLDDIMIG